MRLVTGSRAYNEAETLPVPESRENWNRLAMESSVTRDERRASPSSAGTIWNSTVQGSVAESSSSSFSSKSIQMAESSPVKL